MYALIESNAVSKYPYTPADLRADNPNVSFSATISDAELEAYGVENVVETPPPTITSDEVLVEETPVLIDDTWTQAWSVRNKTLAELLADKNSFISNAKYNMLDYLNAFVHTRDYLSAASCVGFAGSSNAQLASDATYIMTARDSVLLTGYAILGDVQTDVIPVPSMEWFMDQLPELVWPASDTIIARHNSEVL
jgi:hypothetical protein